MNLWRIKQPEKKHLKLFLIVKLKNSMKKRIANRSLILLGLVVSLGLFQAWKESRSPFKILKEKSLNVSIKFTKPSYIDNINGVKIELIKEQYSRKY